jgi:hypothetical protein
MNFQFPGGVPGPDIPPELPVGWIVVGVIAALTALYFWARFLGFA